MLKKFIIGAAAVAAGMVPFAGVAAAEDIPPVDQVGLLNLQNTDVLHNVNATVGVCGNNVNVLGVQVVVEDALNGVALPILSPSHNTAANANPENCASSETADGGTAQFG